MLASLDKEFGERLLDPTFEYREDEFLFWLVDFYFEMDTGQANFLFN